MIPLRLLISGFLSYFEPVELDFESFDLACISGHNGAGKSSLLDAMTWALFGQARRKDDAVINSHAVKNKQPARVMFEFGYEGLNYRVDRSKGFEKTTLLEFQVADANGAWKALTESSVRSTELKIQQTLRMDYETFTNASFFLQGKADQFAQQRPTDRKRILSSILGLEEWEVYRERTAERRKQHENELAAQDGLIAEVDAELAQETVRRARLKQADDELKIQETLRKGRESALESARRLEAALAEQRRLVEVFQAQWQSAAQRVGELNERIGKRQAEREAYLQQLASEPEIRQAYSRWQMDREELQRFEEQARSFRDIEVQRSQPLLVIEGERSALSQELSSLQQRQKLVFEQVELLRANQAELAQARQEEQEVSARYRRWKELRLKLEDLDALAARAQELQNRRGTPLIVLERERTALLQEKTILLNQQRQAEELENQQAVYKSSLQAARVELDQYQRKLAGVGDLQTRLDQSKELRAGLKNENDRLKLDMNVLKERIARLEEVSEGVCPLCGQPLTPEHRGELVAALTDEGREAGDRYRENLERIKTLDGEIINSETGLRDLRSLEQNEFQAKNRQAATLEERLKQNQVAKDTWKGDGALRLDDVIRTLENENFALEARRELAEVDHQVQQLGYDPQIHQSVRQAEQEARSSEIRLQELKTLLARLSERGRQLEQDIAAWESASAPRLTQVEAVLGGEDFAHAARKTLAEVDEKLRALGYDPDAHERTRQAELAGRTREEQLRALEGTRAALNALERELVSLQEQLDREAQSAAGQESVFRQAEAKLEQDQTAQPDLDQLEQEVFELKEQESRLKMQVGAARQQVEVLKQQKVRREQIEKQQEGIRLAIARCRQLERAFGKDGIPALLIEQALPEIEEQANEILDRLSAGEMSVKFATQKDYKDKNREDKKETLEILISDAAGSREYEMFSGGEAFRVNFAIRLALSRVLAQRAGARLQTLVIDEGFGSQDAEGRQRLVEAINLVRPEFAKVLVITHLEELKDAFPARIEVEKTLTGSRVRVL